MRQTIQVNMTKECLYDFLLYHTYSTGMGFLLNVMGFGIVLMGFFTFALNLNLGNPGLYLVAGLFFLVVTPFQLWMRTNRAMKLDERYNSSCNYTFDETGIEIAGKENTTEPEFYAWEQIERIVFAPKNIGFYYGKEEALIVPKQDFGVSFSSIMGLAMQKTRFGTLKMGSLRGKA